MIDPIRAMEWRPRRLELFQDARTDTCCRVGVRFADVHLSLLMKVHC